MDDFIKDIEKYKVPIIWGISMIIGFISGIMVGLNSIK